jgi:hypothetical protein
VHHHRQALGWGDKIGAPEQSARGPVNNSDFTTREKLILAGLYLSKFDADGLRSLGFDNFIEAFNVIGYALGSRPASIKNYRDEFDPLFPNGRKGWHKRPTREYCRQVFERYRHLGLDEFTALVKSFFGVDASAAMETEDLDQVEAGQSAFAQRLATGLAAEQYFASKYREIPPFGGLLMENTTRYGCGYDFRLRSRPDHKEFLAVEVKGLTGQTGTLSVTPKEYEAASVLRERFFLFVVRNFRDAPSHTIFQNPLEAGLDFKRTERTLVQVSWLTAV